MKKTFIAFSLLFISVLTFSQDRNFTQFYASPLTLNPALTGAFEGRHRVGMSYRNQWQSILPDPFTTAGVAFDMNFDAFNIQTVPDKFGIGLTFFTDKVGPGEFSTNNIGFSGAYHKALNPDGTHYLSGGFQFGVMQKSLIYNNLSFNDQFNGSTGYVLPTGEELPSNSMALGDLSAGLQWSLSPKRRTLIYAGLAFHHITQPDVSFYQEDEDIVVDSRLYTKIAGHFGLQLPFGKSSIQPRVIIYMQGPHLEINAGANLSFSVSEYNDKNIILGGWVRPVSDVEEGFDIDAMVVLVGFQLTGFQFGVSYDVNVSNLSNTTSGRGALELSFMYIGDYENESVICPTF
ncbi:MAG: type IX secretion system PorP/SprF family membrane protein [Cognaticolwellia sp.]|jgi:type IX secretion system PorP/SprF family membrane protein